MQDRIASAKAFLLKKLDENPHFQEREAEKAYRIEHSFRVANLGERIAKAQGMDVETMALACLLHDVSYCEEFQSEADWLEHGRRAAAIARPFLETLDLPEDTIHSICYGIAIHVDDKADFEGERTPFALSIGDADNLDRFDAYRVYEGLEKRGYSAFTIEQKRSYVEQSLQRFENYSKMQLATPFATKLWRERITFCKTFVERLQAQLVNSDYPLCAAGTATEKTAL